MTKGMHMEWMRRAAAGVAAVGLGALGFVSAAAAQDTEATPQSAWVKICEQIPVQGGDKRQVCVTHHERLDAAARVLFSAAVRKVEGSETPRLMVQVPLTVQLKPGVGVQIDDIKPLLQLQFSLCHPGGCTAEAEATPEMLAQLEGGKLLKVAATDANGRPFSFGVDLAGFKSSYSGDPVDSKQYAEARLRFRQQLVQQFQERVKAAREQQGEGAATADQ